MLLTSLLVFADNDYCSTSNCLLSPIHWIQLFVSIEVAACLIFLTVYLGKSFCLLCRVLYRIDHKNRHLLVYPLLLLKHATLILSVASAMHIVPLIYSQFIGQNSCELQFVVGCGTMISIVS